MVKRKIKIVPLLLVAMLVCLCCLPASAASNDTRSISRAYFPLSISWQAVTQNNSLRTYERDAWNMLPTIVASSYSWFGPDPVSGVSVPLASLYLDDYMDRPMETDVAYYTVSFEDDVRVIRLDLISPVFIPGSRLQTPPVLQIRAVDADLAISCSISGYRQERASNDTYTAYEVTWTPFTETDANARLESESVYSVDFPEGDVYITSLSLTIIAPDQSGTAQEMNDLNITVSALDSTQYTQYVNSVTVVNSVNFNAQMPSEINVDFVGWLTTAVGAFWEFEIVPGLSIEGVFFGLLGIGVVLAFLKYFAGG